MKDLKARAWTIVLYPDSLPNGWKDYLIELAIPLAISPLHDKDTNATGEAKKEHYHIILRWENTTTFSNVKRIADDLNAPIPKKVESIVGMFRYLTHEDNPDKHQYPSDSVELYNGFDLHIFETMRVGEVNTIIKDIEKIIDDHDISEYYCLIKFLEAQNKSKHAYVARSKTLYISSYINSRRHNKLQDMESKMEDIKTQDFEFNLRKSVLFDELQKMIDFGECSDVVNDMIKNFIEFERNYGKSI